MIRIHATIFEWGDTVGLHIIEEMPNGNRYIAGPVACAQRIDDDYAVQLPASVTLNQRRGEAQQLMDELWRIGLRPTEGSGSAGSLAATQEHLKDMRALVANYASLPFDGKNIGSVVKR